jgi:hypothetical protein
MGTGDTVLLSTFIVLIMAGVGMAIAGITGAGVFTMLTMVFFTFIGFIPMWSSIMAICIGLLILIKGGGR